MKTSEVLSAKSLLLKERDRERVSQGERRRGARGRRQIMGTGLLGHARVEHDVAVARQRRVTLTGDGDGARAEALQVREQRQELVRFAALRDENRDVFSADDSKIAVHAVDGMEKGGRCPGG